MNDVVDNQIWFSLRKSELDENLEKFEIEKKLRRKREAILFVSCLLGLIYFLPLSPIDRQASLIIPAISLKLSLFSALNVFPTIISILYIIVISSSLEQSQLLSLIIQGKKELIFLEVEKIIPKDNLYKDYKVGHRYLLFPSFLHSTFYTNKTSTKVLGKIIYSFVSLIYFAAPLFSNFLFVQKSNSLTGNWWLLLWNSICWLFMIISYFYAFLSIKYFQNQIA